MSRCNMYLKSIEVHGFKSFANKINFQFHNGITCIVGPNGSGKSNVADAVRWVLGEQRIKQLRGASMQDVIFSGTENRKAQGYAYVAITLDNKDHSLAIDYEEVTVARRIYRSGESEYLINGTPCRLKDVNELFYDTGIGKEGYSIIGQGQIDKILSGKPEERRELFDEAAGIVKFKRRKSAAIKKLEDEKLNLLRVTDILKELEKQIHPLEKQSEVAKIYLKKREALKSIDVNMFLLDNQSMKAQLDGFIEKYNIVNQDLEDAKYRYLQMKQEHEYMQQEVETLEERILEERTKLSDTSVLRGKLEGEINVLKEQINSAKESEEHLQTRLISLQAGIDEKTVEKESMLSQKTDFDKQLDDSMQKRQIAKVALDEVLAKIQTINQEIEDGKSSIIQALNDRATIKSKISRLESMIEQMNIRKSELYGKILQAKSHGEEQEEYIQKLSSDFEKVSKEITEYNFRQSQLEEKNHELTDVLSQKDSKLRDTQVMYHQEKSKLDTLKNLTQRYEGYGSSIKKVMEQKESNKGIIGVVADIIATQSKYETAIEIALGGNIQNIVTEDEETAKAMIRFLKDNKSGRATFLPLTSITNPQEFKTPEVLKEPGVLGMADELVQVSKKYKNVAKAMLGRIVVVDHIDQAVKIAKKYDYGVRMVTLEGELLIPGGAISGGTFKNASNLLSRRREMEELEGKVESALHLVDQLLDEIEQTKEERTQIRKEIESVKSQLQDKFIEQNTARMNVIKAQEKREEASHGIERLQFEQEELVQNMESSINEKELIAQELVQSEENEKKMSERILYLQESLDELRKVEYVEGDKLSEFDLEAEKLLQQKGFLQTNLERIEQEVDKFIVELNQINQKMDQNHADKLDRQNKIAEIEKTILASHEVQGDAEVSLKNDIERKDELNRKLKNFIRELEEISERNNILDKEVFRIQGQREKLEEGISARINYMWDEYEITLSDAFGMKVDEMSDLSKLKKEASKLKDEIKKLGDVNVNAIEDFKNLMERYGFLKTQHDDLIEAEKTLQGIIEELDQTMRAQFMEKFGEIGKEFDKVFKELFGGGKATLELMEEEDILEAGIRIVAQPPGKKLQNMMQLSGGEKALTAISLLFAIQNLKPSPFCLLDEIEAALDESNVGRFAKYLHKLTKHTQFIVITHRRGTMEKADCLYGITMQEKGVSALVSVNLMEKELA